MEAFAVPDIPEIEAGDNLAALIAANTVLEDGDIICVASTIVSKAEGRHARLTDYKAGPRAREIAGLLEDLTGDEKDPRFAQAVLDESTELITDAPFLLTETRGGHITVNAGIDRSNVGNDADILLLPKNPSSSAAAIRGDLPHDVSVIVTDTSGRAFRYGQRGVAIGWAGLPANRDWRGETDRGQYELEVTVQSVVDELAGTANLLMGEGDTGTPIVVIRGWAFGNHDGNNALFRSVEDDYVRQALREWSNHAGD